MILFYVFTKVRVCVCVFKIYRYAVELYRHLIIGKCISEHPSVSKMMYIRARAINVAKQNVI